MEILTIIPARNNSKGIPGKNRVPLLGKPLIAWNILASMRSRYVTRTIVSTDGPEIRDIALSYGAGVVMRPDDISGDTASSESALLHVLSWLKDKEGYQPDILVFMQCTSPLTVSEDIDNCIEKLLRENADSATTVTDFHYFIWKEDAGGATGINHDKSFRPRRQDREPQYLETGAVYVMKTEGFLKSRHRFFGKTVLSPMPPDRVKEIDDPVDIVIAENMLRNQLMLRKEDLLPETVSVVFFDFDGVMTDDKVIVGEDGTESVACSREDGMGISLLRKQGGIKLVVLSTEKNPVVAARCRKLKIECYQDLGHSKVEAMKKYLEENGLRPEDTVFMGNDLNDVECMKLAGCAVAPRNAREDVRNIAAIVTDKAGGNGAVREICDLIVSRNKRK